MFNIDIFYIVCLQKDKKSKDKSKKKNKKKCLLL